MPLQAALRRARALPHQAGRNLTFPLTGRRERRSRSRRLQNGDRASPCAERPGGYGRCDIEPTGTTVLDNGQDMHVIGEVRYQDLLLAYNRALLAARAAERRES